MQGVSGLDAGTGERGDERLRVLVVEVLERIDRDGAGALEQVCDENPALAARLRRRIESLRELGLVQAGSHTRLPERLGEFRLIERIGAGGMGVVYRALQESLGREVALKLIRPDVLHQSDAHERFQRETEIVARLQHPGIVPIYTVGDEGDLPWYAMELVQGCTLAEALEPLEGRVAHELSGRDLLVAVCERAKLALPAVPSPLFAGTWEETCLRIVRQVADALDHAHARGVLHRDLKPSNAMVTPEGRVMLLDFGLSQTEGADTLTRTGDHLGSLPFMPPEVLRDGPRAFDRQSDVYALGVSLYKLLTLRLPFASSTLPATMAAILEGRPARPRAHVPGLSWEAETVCLAAMDRDPRRRYATAADFARDLENALERRPVEARRASFALRVRRWVQRRPGEAVALALVVVLPSIAAVLLEREATRARDASELAGSEAQRAREANELAQLEAQRALEATELAQSEARRAQSASELAQFATARAEANLDRTVSTVRTMLDRLSRKELEHVPGMLALREELFARASDMYHQLEQERPNDEDICLFATDIDLNRASLFSRQGRNAELEPILRRTLDLLEPWAQGGPFDLRRARAITLLRLADGVAANDDDEGAATLRSEAIEEMEALLREGGADGQLEGIYLDALSEQVLRDRAAGKPEGSAAELARLQGLARDFAARDPAMGLILLGVILQRCGKLASFEGRFVEAYELQREAFDVYARLLEAEPRDEWKRFLVSESAHDAGRVAKRVDGFDEAQRWLEIAAREIAVVVRDFPGVEQYEEHSARVDTTLGILELDRGRPETAREMLELAASKFELLRERGPDISSVQQNLGEVCTHLSSALLGVGELAAAERALDRARECCEKAIALDPLNHKARQWLAMERIGRADVLLARGLPAEAARQLVEGTELAAGGPNTTVLCVDRLLACIERAVESGDPALAQAVHATARTIGASIEQRGELAGHPALAALQSALEHE